MLRVGLHGVSEGPPKLEPLRPDEPRLPYAPPARDDEVDVPVPGGEGPYKLSLKGEYGG